MASAETNQAGDAPGLPVVRIEKLVHGGLGLGRLEGRVILVERVLPGELVRIHVTGARKDFLEARPAEVLEPAAGRTDPRCPYFGRCGGCGLQHADYSLQCEIKRNILTETLRRIGGISPPQEVAVVAGPPWAYRNRVQLHFDGRALGYFQAGSRRLCAVQRCPIASPKINQALATLREMTRQARFPGWLRTLEIFTDEHQVQINAAASEPGRGLARRFFDWCTERIPGAGAGALEYAAAGETYRVGYRSFFQVNRFLTDELVQCAIGAATGEHALDLYAGVGLFTLPLARRFARVTAVESNAWAARDLEFNAARAARPVAVEISTAARHLARLDHAPDFVLADPPRAGLGPQAAAELLRLKPPRLTIVACDPATLARDLAALVRGGYRLRRLVMVDLFPQTRHIEAVAALDR